MPLILLKQFVSSSSVAKIDLALEIGKFTLCCHSFLCWQEPKLVSAFSTYTFVFLIPSWNLLVYKHSYHIFMLCNYHLVEQIHPSWLGNSQKCINCLQHKQLKIWQLKLLEKKLLHHCKDLIILTFSSSRLSLPDLQKCDILTICRHDTMFCENNLKMKN